MIHKTTMYNIHVHIYFPANLVNGDQGLIVHLAELAVSCMLALCHQFYAFSRFIHIMLSHPV